MLGSAGVRSPALLPSILLVAALAGACGGGDDHRPAEWAYIHAAIVVPSCASASCHGAGTAAGGLDFEEAGATYQTWLEAPYVTPGDPNSAILYLLEGRERDRMPPSSPLPRADIELIRRWIVEGANP
jgi:cytochrome c